VSVKYLYKYGCLNQHSEELFVKPRVWFSSPVELNDPFECKPWYKFDGSHDQIVGAAQEMLQKQQPNLASHMAAAEAARLVRKGRYRDLQVQKLAREVPTRWLSDVGLFCLSSVRDNILMWSHYAGQHRGYCIEFSSAEDDYMFGAAEPVSYSPEYPVVEFFNTSIDEQIQLTFLTKHDGWAYEREWRIIDTRRGSGFRPYPAILFKGVIFGLRMPESDRARIREWVRDRGHPVTFYECLQDARRFAIEVKEVE
jgi:Protein of unknown function (DUF2971)